MQESFEYVVPPVYHQQSFPKNPYNSLDTNNSDYMDDRGIQQRRVLRQSTMPNPDVNLYNSNNNLMPPGSPKQQISPQYSPYNTDNEDVDMTNSPLPARFGIRRQSTLPCPPVAAHFASTSPNRMYSRSPERNDGEGGPRMAPFVRQATFPSNASDPFQQHHQQQRPKLLPTSPNKLNHFSKSPETEMDMQQKQRYQMMRQATLPNPDQHVKLLPTSPPKKQLSPHALKRSPEFVRQNTLPNPEGHNQLNIPQQKFLPISPKHKQSFFFPQTGTAHPRTFLSQQNMPTANEEQVVVAPAHTSVSPIGGSHARGEQSKMIKVRSHSNEEYSITRPMEGRRMLPEIPRNRSPR